jgi:phage terminase large subunit GpA-like protein
MNPSSREGLAAFEQALLDACILMRPPENLTVSQWADKYAMLSAEGSSMPGKFYVSNAEYQREPFDCLSDPRMQMVVLLWASQVGKTQIALIWCAYGMEHDPAPMLFIEPTEDLAKVIVKDRIKPMLRDTPRLRGLVSTGGDQFHMAFPGGQLSMGWANSPTQLASRPIRRLVTDEEGRYGTNSEGDPVAQGRKRMATFANRMHLRVSSPALRRTCRITKAEEQSDQRRYFVPCPECAHMQILRFGQLKGTPDDCFYECEACEYHILESDKPAMIRNGKWIATNPSGGDGKTAGFQLSALYSPIGYTWAEILTDYINCEGIADKLQVFTNTVLAEPWDEQAEGADLNEIAKHAEEYSAQAPSWAVIFTCGADVQKDRIEATKWGWGLNHVSGVIEHRVFYGNTALAKQGAWKEFDEWRRREIWHESGLVLPVACTFVDSGDGNRTQTVYEYCRSREREKVFACKGSSLTGAPLVGAAKRVGKFRALLVIVGSSTAKDIIYSRLQIEKGNPGYIHFPKSVESGCTPEYFSHLTAEALVTRQTKGGEVSKWEKQRSRNEALDCAVYAYAAKEFTRAPLGELARRLQAKAVKLPEDERPGGKMYNAARLAVALLPLLSSESSPASPSPAPKPRKKLSKIIRRPGFGWIQGN